MFSDVSVSIGYVPFREQDYGADCVIQLPYLETCLTPYEPFKEVCHVEQSALTQI